MRPVFHLVRTKNLRQSGRLHFISVSLVLIICGKLRLLLDLWINARMQIRRLCEHTSNLLTSYCILFSLYDDVGANAINGTQKEAVARNLRLRATVPLTYTQRICIRCACSRRRAMRSAVAGCVENRLLNEKSCPANGLMMHMCAVSGVASGSGAPCTA